MSASASQRRPTTPLRRLSASSLRSLSLSHSLSHPPTTNEPPISHLSHVVAELADSLADLSSNFEQLDRVNVTLDGWNEAFAGYLYGLRVNAYTADFGEAPTRDDFVALASRRPPTPPMPLVVHESDRELDGENTAHTAELGRDDANDATFVTHESEYSFLRHEPQHATAGSKTGAKSKHVLTKRQKADQLAFSDTIIQMLPIPFREQPAQRTCVETLLPILRSNPSGMSLADLDITMPSIPKHRINEALTALARAKIVIKTGLKYRLDPSKYS